LDFHRQAASDAANVCLTSIRFASADIGTGCDESSFLVGWLDDQDWCARLLMEGMRAEG